MLSTPNSNATLGTILKRARTLAELTQIEVADRLGVSRWTYIALENGRGTFHSEWIDKLPDVMRNPVIMYFQREHQKAIERLRQKLILEVEEDEEEPIPVPAARPSVIPRPTGVNPSLIDKASAVREAPRLAR
jgi:transcriptional regulator with XRE-family HTH domain